MKKSLLAVAALGAFASAAQAQSSVTVYGIMDAGYVGGNMRAVDSKGVVTKTQVSQFGQSQENTSRLGFKGTEDLGGGTSAFFTIEAGLTPQNPALGGTVARDSFQGTDQNGGSSIDNRQSFVGLKKNGLGQAAFGRQYTVIFNAGAATDPSQYANVLGNVIYNGSSITGVDGSGGNTGSSANAAFTNRASNALTFQSDKFAGFGLNGMYALNNQNATQYATQGYLAAGTSTGLSSAGGNTNWNGWGLSGDFAWQKLYLTVAYQSFKTQYSNAVLGSGSATSVNLGSSATGGQVIPAGQTLFPASTLADKQTYVGGTYDFGVLKAYAQWVGRKIQQDNANGLAATGQTGAQLNRTAQQIGVRSFITPTIEAWGSAGTGKVKGAPLLATGDLASVNFVGWQLGSNYYLSKRTNLYAIYGQQQSTSATGGTAGSGATANQYALGMRHTF